MVFEEFSESNRPIGKLTFNIDYLKYWEFFITIVRYRELDIDL